MIETIADIDQDVFLVLNGELGKAADQIFFMASSKLIWAPLYLLILWLIYRRYGWKTMLASLVFVVLTVTLADQVCNLFKDAFQKLRPTHNPLIQLDTHTVNGYRGGLYGTFSAHAATTAGIAMFTASVLRLRLYTVLICVWVALVSYSRIYLGVHFPLDVICGALTGVLIGWGMFRLFRLRMLTQYYALEWE